MSSGLEGIAGPFNACCYRETCIATQSTVDTLRAQLEAAELRDAQMQDAFRLMRDRAEAAEAECAAMRSLIVRVVADTKWRSDDNTLWPDLCDAARTKEETK